MGRAGYRDSGGRKGRLWKKMDALNTFVDKAMPHIAHLDAAIWIALFRNARDGIVTRAVSSLSKDVGVSGRTVRRAIDRLKTVGLIRVERQGGLGVGASTLRLGVRDLGPAPQGVTDDPTVDAGESPPEDTRDHP